MTHRFIHILLAVLLLSGIASVDAVNPSRWRTTHTSNDSITNDSIPNDSIPNDTIPNDSIPNDSIPSDTIPNDTIPNDTIPNDTIPNDTIPNDTIPNDTIPNDTIPNDTIPNDTIPNDTIPNDTIPNDSIPADSILYLGDLNMDRVLDVSDVNLMINTILDYRCISNDAFGLADIVADRVIDVSDLNYQIQWMLSGELVPFVVVPTDTVPTDTVPPDTVPVDTLPRKGWVPLPPDSILKNMIITFDRNRYDFSSGRLLMWNVTPGDTLRLTVDHDNSINVTMRTYMFYPESDHTTWLADNAIAAGPNIKTIAGRDTMLLTVPDGAGVLVCSGFWFENGRIGDNASAATNPYTAFALERWGDTRGLTPRPQLRVLAVGNSFTCDELSYVPYVIQSLAPEIDLHLRLITRPSGHLEGWSDYPDSISHDGAKSVFYDWQPFPGRWTTPVRGTLRESLDADDWDIITLQQVSKLPYWDSVQRPLHTITTWLRDTLDYHGRIGWVLNHAYSDSNVCTSEAFPQINTSDQMWQLNQQLADSVMHSGCVDLLIPSGTAVQNARHTSLIRFTYNQLCAGNWTSGNNGNTHLQEGIGPFVAACAAAGALIDVPPDGATVQLSSTWRIPNANPSYYQKEGTNPTLQFIEDRMGGLGMDPDSQALGAWCAGQAILHPFQLIEHEPDENE